MLSMLGHMSRMPLSADAYKAIYQDIPSDWRRRPGRPRQSPLATIGLHRHLPKLDIGLDNVPELAADHVLWKGLICGATHQSSVCYWWWGYINSLDLTNYFYLFCYFFSQRSCFYSKPLRHWWPFMCWCAVKKLLTHSWMALSQSRGGVIDDWKAPCNMSEEWTKNVPRRVTMHRTNRLLVLCE